jgi:hypothetical protein
MSGHITRRLKPEEEEILRKREELGAIRATLAERELELVDFRSQLAAFEGSYLREVGALYAELDEWMARISELHARLDPSASAKEQAQKAREQARQTYEEAHGKASEARDFTPSPELKSLFREVAKRIHPDFRRIPPTWSGAHGSWLRPTAPMKRVTPRPSSVFSTNTRTAQTPWRARGSAPN